MENKGLELYIHIPFCIRKCAYCDFLSFSSDFNERKSYVDALLMEIEQYRKVAKQYDVTTIFIGGGTPSVLEIDLMSKIMNKIKEIFVISTDAEISIEVNPGTMTLQKAVAYKTLGVNRVSIGLQATSDEELRMLGRIHNYKQFLETYHCIQKSGISNINIDLITAIPKQTVESWTKTLERVIALNPTHISAYCLIIEEGTKFHDNLVQYEDLLPDEESERDMYHLTKFKLYEAGYERYEISNYAKEGYECRHNLGYWNRIDYIGIGLGAASLLDNVRYMNENDMKSYIDKCNNLKSVYIDKEELTVQAQMEEFMFLGLRKTKGVSAVDFKRNFGIELEEIYGEVMKKLKEKGLIRIEGDSKVQLTELGLDVSNQVMAEFLL